MLYKRLASHYPTRNRLENYFATLYPDLPDAKNQRAKNVRTEHFRLFEHVGVLGDTHVCQVRGHEFLGTHMYARCTYSTGKASLGLSALTILRGIVEGSTMA